MVISKFKNVAWSPLYSTLSSSCFRYISQIDLSVLHHHLYRKDHQWSALLSENVLHWFYQKKLVTTCILLHRNIKKLFSQNGAVSVPIGMPIVSFIITFLTLGKHYSIKWSIAVLNDVLLKLGTHWGFKWILTADLKFWIKRENQKLLTVSESSFPFFQFFR